MLLGSLLSIEGRAENSPSNQSLQQAFASRDSVNHPFIGYLKIGDKQPISESTWIYVKTTLDELKKRNPLFILVHIDTPGGEVIACEKIGLELRRLAKTDGIPTVAYIDHWALSGGALVAYNCQFIYVAEGAVMGAATPVLQGAQGKMEIAPEKIISALRADFSSAAQAFGRNEWLAQAMVDADLFVVQQNGEIVSIDPEEEQEGDVVVSSPGKLLTLTYQELAEYGVAEGILFPKHSKSSQSTWPFAQEPLSEEPFFAQYADLQVESPSPSWPVKILAWLSLPAISSILFFGVLVGGYIELQAPGMSWPGAIALFCLCLLGVSSFSLDALNWLELALVGIGVLLICLEVFVIPGFGIPGILGGVCLFVGLILLALPSLSWLGEYLETGAYASQFTELTYRIIGLLAACVAAAIAGALVLRWFASPRARKLQIVSYGEQKREEGFEASGGGLNLSLLGKQGEVEMVLRPSGYVRIDNTLYAAQSLGGFVEKGAKVEVIEVRGKSVIVEEKK